MRRPYDDISVRDVTERADVGRSTFYSHFDSKEELLFAGFEDWLTTLHTGVYGAHGDVAAAFEGPGDGRGEVRFRFSLPLLRHIATQPRSARATLGPRGRPRIQRRVRSILVQVVLPELAATGVGPWTPAARGGEPVSPAVRGGDPGARGQRGGGADAPAAREARAHAVVGALLGVVGWWLDGHERMPPEVVDRAFQRVVAGA